MYKKLISLDNLSNEFDHKFDKNAKNIVDRAITYFGTQTFVPSSNTDNANTDGNGYWYYGNLIKGSDGLTYLCTDDTPGAAVWMDYPSSPFFKTGVNGNLFQEIFEFGEMATQIEDGGYPSNGPIYIYPRVGHPLVTQAGTILATATLLYGTGADNTSVAGIIRRITPDGTVGVSKIFTRAAGSWGNYTIGTTICDNFGCLIQHPNGTILNIRTLLVIGDNTASPWYDFDGLSPAQTWGQKVLVLKSVDDGLTWTDLEGNPTDLGTDITNQIIAPDKRNQMSISSFANNGSGKYRVTMSGGPADTFVGTRVNITSWGDNGTDYTIVTASDFSPATASFMLYFKDVTDAGGSNLNNKAILVTRTSANNYTLTGSGKVGTPSGGTLQYSNIFVLKFSGLSGTNAAALLAKNWYAVAVTQTTYDLIQATDLTASPDATLGNPTLTSAKATPLLGSFTLGGNACVGNDNNRLIFPGNGRAGVAEIGTSQAFFFYTDDLLTFQMSTYDTSLNAVGMIEPGIIRLKNGHILVDSRQSTGNVRQISISTDNGSSFGPTANSVIACVPTMSGIAETPDGYLLVCPTDATIRTGMVVYRAIVDDNDNITWSNPRRLKYGRGGYSGLSRKSGSRYIALMEHGNILDATGLGIGRIHAVEFNLAEISRGHDPSIIYPCTDLPVGQVAWTDHIGVFDIGGGGQHAIVRGAPVYLADGLRFATGTDYLEVTAAASTHDSTFDPDVLTSDNGSFTVQLGLRCPNAAGLGTIFGADPRIGTVAGAGNGGWKIDMTVGHARLILDDGVNTVATTTTGTLNDGAPYRVVLQRDTTGVNGAAHKLNWWLYNGTTGALINSGVVSDTTTIAKGALTNLSTLKRFFANSDGTGAFNNTFDLLFFQFDRRALKPTEFAPIPYVKTINQGSLGTTRIGGPGDTNIIPTDKLDLWLNPADEYFGHRTRTASSWMLPDSYSNGNWQAGFQVERSHGYFTSSGICNCVRGLKDTIIGNNWRWFPTNGRTYLDDRTKNLLKDFYNFSGPCCVFGKFYFPAAWADSHHYAIRNDDGTHGFALTTGSNGTRRLGWLAENDVTTGFFETGDLYNADTWYWMCLSYDGSHGAGATGMEYWFVPLTTKNLQASDISNGHHTNWVVRSGSTSLGNATSTSAIYFGDNGTNQTRVDWCSDICFARIQMDNTKALSLARDCMLG